MNFNMVEVVTSKYSTCNHVMALYEQELWEEIKKTIIVEDFFQNQVVPFIHTVIIRKMTKEYSSFDCIKYAPPKFCNYLISN
jgi:hypothetical protein